MFFITKGHDFINELQTMTQVFYPNEKFIRVSTVSADGITVVSECSENCCISQIFHNGVLISRYEMSIDDEPAFCVKKCMFHCLVGAENYIPDWGILTGIRPSKIVHTLRERGITNEEIIRHFVGEFNVSSSKAELCLRVADAESKVFARARGKFSIYIGIPFCPSRCLYCSFTSQPIDYTLSDLYLAALEKELTAFSYPMPDAVYIGGGTPTSFDLLRLERLLTIVDRTFPKRTEYTVEAGRPDTLDRDKLQLLKAHNVTRLSINPQTMNDRTLALIGRNHTSARFLEAFKAARSCGHDNINVDLILGLPEESISDVIHSLKSALALKPENLTAHVLAVKRASRLKEELLEASGCPRRDDRAVIESMITATETMTSAANMHPYYLYRQKNMLGNFENVGYSKKDFECIYNVMIMAERQTILAFGAGAITKTVNTQNIERIFNVKNVDDYIKRIDEMIDRKKIFFDKLELEENSK